MSNSISALPDTQERLHAYEERLFQIAFDIGCECDRLRVLAEDSGLPEDKQAYVAKWKELRLAVLAHKEAVNICNLYTKLT